MDDGMDYAEMLSLAFARELPKKGGLVLEIWLKTLPQTAKHFTKHFPSRFLLALAFFGLFLIMRCGGARMVGADLKEFEVEDDSGRSESMEDWRGGGGDGEGDGMRGMEMGWKVREGERGG